MAGDLVTFRWTFQFERDGTQPTSDSTLRFPGRMEIVSFLSAHGVDVVDIRRCPGPPGLELVFVARAGRPAATLLRA